MCHQHMSQDHIEHVSLTHQLDSETPEDIPGTRCSLMEQRNLVNIQLGQLTCLCTCQRKISIKLLLLVYSFIQKYHCCAQFFKFMFTTIIYFIHLPLTHTHIQNRLQLFTTIKNNNYNIKLHLIHIKLLCMIIYKKCGE